MSETSPEPIVGSKVGPADHWDNWRFKLYLRLILKAFVDVLGVTQDAIATKAGIKASYLPGILDSKPLTAEKFADLETGMIAVLDERVAALKKGDEEGRQRVEEARRLLDGGLDRRVQLAMALSQARPRQEEAIPHSEKSRLLLAEVINGQILATEELRPIQIFETVKRIYPHLAREELGFAYHAVGDAVLNVNDINLGTPTYAADLFQLATKYHIEAMIAASIQLVRCHLARLRFGACTEQERTALDDQIRELISDCDLLANRFPLPLYKVADEFLIAAQHLAERLEADAERTDSKGIDRQLQVREFERVGRFYEQAISQQDLRRYPERTEYDLAHLYHNVGYCRYRAYKPGEAIEYFEKAVELYAEQGLPEKVAYNFKWLSIMYRRLAGRKLALWCARASVAIYQTKGASSNVGDINDALKQLGKCERLAEGSSFAFPSQIDGIKLAQEYREVAQKVKKEDLP